jgi:hypothetical protein
MIVTPRSKVAAQAAISQRDVQNPAYRLARYFY